MSRYLTPEQQEESRAICQAILDLCAGHLVPVSMQAQLDALAVGIAAIHGSRADASAFVDALVSDLKAHVEKWHGHIEMTGPLPTRKHQA